MSLSWGNPSEVCPEAIISVLHEDGKDSILYEAFRPVSLLCNDFFFLNSSNNHTDVELAESTQIKQVLFQGDKVWTTSGEQ